MSWSLLILVVVPLVGWATLFLNRSPARWGPVAAAAALAQFLLCLAMALMERSGAYSALAANAGITTVVLFAQPRRGLSRRDSALPLLWLSSGALVLIASDVRWLLLGWVVPPLAAWWTLNRLSERESRARKMVGGYLVLGCLPLLAAGGLFAFAAHRRGYAAPFALASWDASLLSPTLAGVIFMLVAVGVMFRLGVPPFHSWMPTVVESLPPGTALSLTGVQMAVHVMVRMALAPLPHALPSESAVIMGLGVIGMLYGTLMAASQQRLRRLVAFVAVAQSSALLVGLSLGDLVSVSGALANAISVALTSRGLMLATASIESRMGQVDLRQLSGVSQPAPRLGAVSLMLALAAVGIPGSLGFVGEDLLLQGLVHDHPAVAGLMVVCTAVLAIALLRGMLKTCFGPAPSWSSTVPDLLPRERVLVLLALGLLFLGVWPKPLVNAHRADAEAMLQSVSGEPH